VVHRAAQLHDAVGDAHVHLVLRRVRRAEDLRLDLARERDVVELAIVVAQRRRGLVGGALRHAGGVPGRLRGLIGRMMQGRRRPVAGLVAAPAIHARCERAGGCSRREKDATLRPPPDPAGGPTAQDHLMTSDLAFRLPGYPRVAGVQHARPSG
jgi:hypothetical protein